MHAVVTHLSVVPAIQLQPVNVRFKAIGVIAFVHLLERVGCVRQNVRSRFIHRQIGSGCIWGNLSFRRCLTGGGFPIAGLPEREESAVRIRGVFRIIGCGFVIAPDSVCALCERSVAKQTRAVSRTFIHIEVLPGHFRKSPARSFLEKNFSRTQDPAGC